ncbi:MAG: hypothetical protein A2268_02140 [Candidatus Raymondbacteria bacterium RifOxyA12_full_50_37]|uniref:Glycosyl transferase family 28 C-terminal domain-containing protein n=1 Tax=Candidatus Raymondbacteria bacterium RIFOXYD12_FULL_49_13 TaxID=1817890 RepID=A0A1F7F4X6_UNCRA|nr:MAG: hypothetical protein A2268_02140 [Candidatus Raymondbacteria bacterium RifOxyA12_full_50_37]OGJ91291.1 MAG: hypothetical protein A2350_13195 [Candidatus Raymondbacteria bacterium RifOxyB12_full_50_8]OGJ92228.1 MAG: hypothetical protein A2248_10970 [Candidatus Raymondbacteria bacterium RIFOXYA2_FULL_49_16]OGJ98554.1 MAG: hypothetical protein A2453_06770 [Candidatus Raymondbacteria bacterium RIFOXYC2_FULL_50_21]OGK01587.1 MAG: hypothetical protein A2519_05960 [Candidatus Raymondbacteria b
MLILTIVGSGKWQFDRLLRAMDEIASETPHKVICQTGFSHYTPKQCEWFTFKPYEQLIAHYREADLVVAHASAGPRIYAVKFGKPIIIMPRDNTLGENLDGHQLEVAAAIKKENYPTQKVIYSADELPAAIEMFACPGIPHKAPDTGLSRLISALRQEIGLQGGN